MQEKKLKSKILENRRSKNGITLIALVITIIVLLILAGVALATLTGQENIIGNAENAVGKYNNSVAGEQQFLNEIEKYFQNYLEGGNGDNPPTPPEPTGPVDSNGLAKENTTIKPDKNSDVQIIIPAGFAPAILATGTTQSLPGQNGSVKEIMPYEQWNSITVEDINKGIVIVDNAITYDGGNPTGTTPDFNEYVWIPIPDISEFKRIAWITPSTWDGNGNWIDGSNTTIKHPISDEEIANYYWEDTTTIEYMNMKNSIEYYKGFYIGRYEASNNGKNITQSKRNQSPWTEVDLTAAKESCSDSTMDNIHLMYGVEWDTTLNWLLESKAIISSSIEKTEKIIELSDIQTNSSSWGNYYNSIGNAMTEPWEAKKVQNTGASEYWKVNNIYDLAGNVWELTQETYISWVNRAVIRAGSSNNADEHPVSYRGSMSQSSSTIGFRCSFFIALDTGSDE